MSRLPISVEIRTVDDLSPRERELIYSLMCAGLASNKEIARRFRISEDDVVSVWHLCKDRHAKEQGNPLEQRGERKTRERPKNAKCIPNGDPQVTSSGRKRKRQESTGSQSRSEESGREVLDPATVGNDASALQQGDI